MTKMYLVEFYDVVTQTRGYAPMSKVLEILEGNDLQNDMIKLVNGTLHECVNRHFENSITEVGLDL